MNLYQEIIEAAEKLYPYIYETPLEKSFILSEEYKTNIFFKQEHLQKTGSFKYRGALNKLLSLSPFEKSCGIVAASTGNHGHAVALAAKDNNISATIYVPKNSSSLKIELIKSFNAQIKICEGDCLAAEIEARQTAIEKNLTFVSPYNDKQVIAGQGTIGVELFNQHKDLNAVFVTVGGGGLISGIASYLKQIKPNIKIIGCSPQNVPVMYECLKAKKIIEVSEQATLSEATAGGIEENSITLDFCLKYLDDFILVTEEEITEAWKSILKYERFIVESAAAVAFAAFRRVSQHYKNLNIAIVLCGRNISFEKYVGFLK